MTICSKIIKTYFFGLPFSLGYQAVQAKKDLGNRKLEILDEWGSISRDRGLSPKSLYNDVANDFRWMRRDLTENAIKRALYYPMNCGQILTEKAMEAVDDRLYEKDLDVIMETLKKIENEKAKEENDEDLGSGADKKGGGWW